MRFLLLSTDLMLVSAAQGAADRHGVRLVPAARADQLIEASVETAAPVIAIDLRSPGLNIGDLVHRLRERCAVSAKIVAFGPHVHEQSLAAAAAAGCDEVFTRGQFERRLDGLLAELTAPAD